MLKRIITGLLLVGLVVLALYLGTLSYIALDMLVMIFALVGTYEIYHSFRKSGYINNCIPLFILGLGIYPMWYFFGISGLAIIFAVTLLASLTIFTFKQDMGINDLLATIFTFIYPFALVSIAFSLSREYACGGVFAISMAVFMPVFSDVFAYFVGSAIGKRKLCPSISPKKTVAGAVGGVCGSIICSVAFFLLFDYFKVVGLGYVPFTDNVGVAAAVYCIIGLVCGIFAEVGDLAASRIKRTLGIKDFGNIFPGHGGVLDRLDSIMFTLVLLFIAMEIAY